MVKNGRYKKVNRKLSRLISKEVSKFRRALTTIPAHVSGDFTFREFTTALQHLKPGNAPGLDLLGTELIIHAGRLLL